MNRLSQFALPALLAATASVALAQKPTPLERGKYLMEGVVACGNCHFARGPQGQPLADKGLSGGMLFDEPPFKAYASNITPDADTGIGKWTDAQLAKAIREGVRPETNFERDGERVNKNGYRTEVSCSECARAQWQRSGSGARSSTASIASTDSVG